MAGRALHSAGEERNVPIAVNGIQVRSGLQANSGRSGGIRIYKVDRVLFGQVSCGHVVAHKCRSLRQGLEVASRLRLIPRINGNCSIMAAQAQVAHRQLAAEFGRSRPHAVTGVDAIRAYI